MADRVITNAHVIPEKLDVDHNESIAIFSGRGAKARARSARVVRTDKDHDLALLEFQGGDTARHATGQLRYGAGRSGNRVHRLSPLAWCWVYTR